MRLQRFPQRPSAAPPSGAGDPAQRRPPNRGPERAENWLYGLHAVQAALANPRRKLHRAVLTARAAESLGEKLLGRVRVEPADADAISRLLPPGAVHQGAALSCDPLPGTDLDDDFGSRRRPAAAGSWWCWISYPIPTMSEPSCGLPPPSALPPWWCRTVMRLPSPAPWPKPPPGRWKPALYRSGEYRPCARPLGRGRILARGTGRRWRRDAGAARRPGVTSRWCWDRKVTASAGWCGNIATRPLSFLSKARWRASTSPMPPPSPCTKSDVPDPSKHTGFLPRMAKPLAGEFASSSVANGASGLARVADRWGNLQGKAWLSHQGKMERDMRSVLLWAIGIPLPIIIILWLVTGHA